MIAIIQTATFGAGTAIMVAAGYSNPKSAMAIMLGFVSAQVLRSLSDFGNP